MKTHIIRITLMTLFTVFTHFANSAPSKGTYNTSFQTSLNSFIGVYKGNKYVLGDHVGIYEPSIVIKKDPVNQPYGYTLSLSIPCQTKIIPTVYSVNYNGNEMVLVQEGHSQCSIAENFRVRMYRPLDMADGTLGPATITLDLGYLSPTFPSGSVTFEYHSDLL